MLNLNKYNDRNNLFTFESDDLEYMTASELIVEGESKSKFYPLKGFFINRKAKWQHPVLVCEKFKVSISTRFTDTFEEAFNDNELVEAINDDKVKVRFFRYITKEGLDRYSYELKEV